MSACVNSILIIKGNERCYLTLPTFFLSKKELLKYLIGQDLILEIKD